MKVYIILAILLATLIGTSLAQNATTGDVNAFKQALEKDGFIVQKGGLGFFDAIKLHDLGSLTFMLRHQSYHEIFGVLCSTSAGSRGSCAVC
jgi:hypothetical protein